MQLNTFPGGSNNRIVIGYGGLVTTSAGYTALGHFIFPGSAVVGVPSIIKTILDSASTGNCRIVDLTNGAAVIAEVLGFGAGPAIVDMGVLSNIPTGEAIFEVQLARATGGGGSAQTLQGLTVEF